jgi:hypothetical protein
MSTHTLTAEQSASIARVEAEWSQSVVAIALDADGTIYDHAFTWETAQTLALSEGLQVIATADDGHMDTATAQALYNAELDRYRDCFSS